MLYRALIRPILYVVPAEAAHRFAFSCLRILTTIPGFRSLLRRVLLPRVPSLTVRVLGLEFPTPIGLAAGFDKDALGFEALGALGFGFVEVGTLTSRAQPGRPKPRLFRLPRDRALVNRMGFNNRGARDAVPRLAGRRRTVVGVNIGKHASVSDTGTVDDYQETAALVAPHADYVAVNVSSPNTPGLRDLQGIERLRPLLAGVRKALDEASSDRHVPLLVKIAPDLVDEDIEMIADLAVELALDGIIATNTTISREGLETDASEVDRCGSGGLSGPPVAERSLRILRLLRHRLGDRLVLISVGGVESAAQAWERIQAGASLVQVYTGFVYQGPALPRRLAKGVARSAAQAGFQTVQDAVGSSSM